MLARAKALEAQGKDMIHLQIGEPDFDTPPHIVEAAVTGAARRVRPTTAPRPASRSCARRRPTTCRARARSSIDPARVLVTPGAKPFLFFGVLATCNPGDEVIYPNPGFPIYESVIRWAGATPVPLPLTEERGFAFSADDLAERLTPKHEARDPQLARQPDRRRRARAR